MFNITSGTVILLGGNVTVAADSDLTATVSASGTAFSQVGAAAALAASGTFQTATPVRVRFASGETMSSTATVVAGITVHVQAAASVLSADLGMASAGGLVYTDPTADLVGDSELSAAGGGIIQADSPGLSESLTMTGSGGYQLDAAADLFTFTVTVDVSANPVYRLNLPTADQVLHDDYFFERYKTPTGVSLVITGGTGRLVQYPSDEELNAADAYFLGGYRHDITPAERAQIISAGFGDLLEEA